MPLNQSWADRDAPKMGIFTKKDAAIDLGLQFQDAQGRQVTLAQLVKKDTPVILVPIFYDCPRLCGLTTAGVVKLVNSLPERLGADYTIIAYSFNSQETAAAALKKKQAVFAQLKSPPHDADWEFLVGSESSVLRLSEQIGFRFRRADQELEHSSAIFVLSPQGRVRGYVAGVEFPVKKIEALLGAKP